MKTLYINDKPTSYKIDTLGNIYNSSGRKLKVQKNEYASYLLTIDGKQTYQSLHRLLAIHYIRKPADTEVVNHIDGNKYNNAIENLEWCSRSENAKHAYEKLWIMQRDTKGKFTKNKRRI